SGFVFSAAAAGWFAAVVAVVIFIQSVPFVKRCNSLGHSLKQLPAGASLVYRHYPKRVLRRFRRVSQRYFQALPRKAIPAAVHAAGIRMNRSLPALPN
ncbi:hypothetical protein RLK13_08485, partial [Streptococcus pneumoniae]|nr:hypothetical protein [Streptococcus pneumoniae]